MVCCFYHPRPGPFGKNTTLASQNLFVLQPTRLLLKSMLQLLVGCVGEEVGGNEAGEIVCEDGRFVHAKDIPSSIMPGPRDALDAQRFAGGRVDGDQRTIQAHSPAAHAEACGHHGVEAL